MIAECGFLNCGLRIADFGLQISRLWISDFIAFAIVLRNPQSEIRNPKSAIEKSAIRNS
jgi:hypothetical protein